MIPIAILEEIMFSIYKANELICFEYEPKLYDSVWIILGRLAIKCKIIKIDDWARKDSPTAYLFYDVDEPVGHSLAEYDLCYSKEEAIKKLVKKLISTVNVVMNEPEEFSDALDNIYKSDSLEETRKDHIDFIASTRSNKSDRQEVHEHFKKFLTPKNHETEWVSIKDIISREDIEQVICGPSHLKLFKVNDDY